MKKIFTILTVLILSIGLFNCPNPTNDKDDSTTTDTFVAVTSITDVPSSGSINQEITLSGKVNPNNATNKTITWSIKDKGTTNSILNGDKLTASNIGTVKITATIGNGKTESTNYTSDFDIVIYDPSATYTVSFNVNGGNEVYQQQTVTYGNTATNPGNPTKDGYSFIEWQLNNIAFDFNTPITENIVLTAKWEEIVMPKIYFGSIIGATTTATDLATRFTAFEKTGNSQTLIANIQGGYATVLIPEIYGEPVITQAGLPTNMPMTKIMLDNISYYQYRNGAPQAAGETSRVITFNN